MRTTRRATIDFDADVHHTSGMANEAVRITLAENADDLRAVEIRQTEERPIRAGSDVSMAWPVMAAKDAIASIQ